MKTAFALWIVAATLARGADRDPAADVWDVVATMAAALAEPNEYAFMKPVSKSFEQYEMLERQVRTLVQTNDVVSAISPVTNEGDDKERQLEVDWYVEIKPQASKQTMTQRHLNVKLTLVKNGKHWMITTLSPISFFAPPE
jgi:hypothetical protein